MIADAASFDHFMDGREAVGLAYVTGSAAPLAAISAQHGPATLFRQTAAT
jgi:hypothetical protein